MPKFRKKPVVIEARQYTRNGLEAERVAEWCGGTQVNEGLMLRTLEGPGLVNYGDWVIKGIHDEFYSCKSNIFEATYELVE